MLFFIVSLLLLGCHAAEKPNEFTMDVVFVNAAMQVVIIGDPQEDIRSYLELAVKPQSSSNNNENNWKYADHFPVKFKLGSSGFNNSVYKGSILVGFLSKSKIIDPREYTLFLQDKPETLIAGVYIDEILSLFGGPKSALKLRPKPETHHFATSVSLDTLKFKFNKQD
jgi:hypothetical protein